MKKNYTFLILLFISGLGYGQGTETFQNVCTSSCSPSNSSYANRTWTGDDGSTWNATNSRTSEPIIGAAITMNDDESNTYIQSGIISGGVGNITITTQRKFSGGSGNINVLINGTNVGTVTYSGSIQTTTISGINIAGDIVIRINNDIGGNNNGGADRVAIDDVTWTAFGGAPCTTPTDVTSLTTVAGNTEVDLSWSNETCFDEILVVAKEATSVTVTPTGDGSLYTANNNFGDGTDIGSNEYIVYKGTGTEVTVTGLTNTTAYFFKVFARKDSSWSSGIEENETPVLSWCIPTPSSVDGNGITNVSLGSIDNSTGAESGNYGDYSAQSTDLEQGQNVTCAITFETGFTYNTKIWIDYNNDGDFDDANEEVYSGTSTASNPTTLNANFTVPISASLGQHRIRIGSADAGGFGGEVIPCYNDAYGSYEDYTINVIAPSTDTQVEFTLASASVSEGVGTYDLEFSITNEALLANTTFDVVLTNGDAADIDNYTTQSVLFLASINTNQTVTITVTDDVVFETDETLTFTIQNVEGGNNAIAGTVSSFDLTITNNDATPPITLPYNEDFSDCSTAAWTPFDEAGPTDVWICENGEYTMNGFGDEDDIDWLISDFTIDFDAYSTVEIDVITRERYGNTVNEAGEFELVYSIDYLGGDPTTATWTALNFDPNNTSSGGSLSTASTTTVDASNISGIAYIAFVYDMTVSSGAEEWRILDITISGVLDNGNSSNADIVESGFDEPDNIDYINYSSTNNLLSSNALKIGEFTIRDAGFAPNDTDALTTTLTDISFVVAGFDNIAALSIFDGPANIAEETTVTAVTSFTGLNISAPDDGTYTFSVYATFKSVVTDNDQIQLTISAATADISGSTFTDSDASGATTSITGDDNRIEVTATDLIFNQDVTDIEVNSVMSPSPTVLAIDSNVNIDLDFTDSINLTPSTAGVFSSTATTAVNAVAGESTFDNLLFDTIGSGYVLTASSGALNSDTSNSFDVTVVPVAPVIIALQDFDGTTPEWTYTNEVSFFDNGWGNDGYYGIIDINLASPINQANMLNNILGENDLNDEGNGTNGFATTTFATINITAYQDVELTFDWDIVGYNANNDDARYQVFYDGIGQGIIYLLDGNGSTETNDGTVSISIPDIVNNVHLEIQIRNDGGSGYSGFDNFKLEGKLIPVSTYTYNNDTWSPSDPNGASDTSQDIIIASGDAIISSNTDINTVTINPGASITIDTGVTLNATSVTLESVSNAYSSLILDGNIVGTITYERFVNVIGSGNSGTGNDLISLPLIPSVGGMSFDEFIDLGDPANSTKLATNGVFYAFAPYNNLLLQFINFLNEGTDNLESGKGYRVATTTGENLTFSGDVPTGNIAVDISTPTIANSQWNLIGNPFPSYVNSMDFLSANSGVFDDSAVAIYGYNSGTFSGSGETSEKFTVINMVSNSGLNIAPGQGFFIAARNTINFSGSIGFTDGTMIPTDMRTTSGTDDFIEGRSSTVNYKLKLSLTNSEIYTTSFYFNSNASLGLDPGYDAATFDGFGNSYKLYSHLVENNEGRNMTIQALGEDDINNVIIPLGVKSNQGEQITFSISETSLPSTINVYLEDNVNNTTTLLNSSDYTLTLNQNTSGTGRFYLRITNGLLSNTLNTLDHLNIYNNQENKTVVIEGQLSENTITKIYDLQGRVVNISTLYTSETTQSINVNNLNSGVYIVQLSNKSQLKTQKIILK